LADEFVHKAVCIDHGTEAMRLLWSSVDVTGVVAMVEGMTGYRGPQIPALAIEVALQPSTKKTSITTLTRQSDAGVGSVRSISMNDCL
jgi:hypothetical protein